MPFPPNWNRIQSPFHVKSYSLAEHGRWALLMMLICLYWLKEEHLKRPFVAAMTVTFSEEVNQGKSIPDILTSALALLVKSNGLLTGPFIDIIDRDPVLFKKAITDSRRIFQRICEAAARASKPARGAAQQKSAAKHGVTAMAPPPRPSRATSRVPASPTPFDRGQRAASRAASVSADSIANYIRQTRSVSVAQNVDDDEADEAIPSFEEDEEDVAYDIDVVKLTKSQKAVKYRRWAARPNVHTGLHYVGDLERFGLPSLQMNLPGEMKHK